MKFNDSHLHHIDILCDEARTHADDFMDSLNFREHSSVLADMATVMTLLDEVIKTVQRYYDAGGDAA
ncbi:hypothetical protein [Mycolicibacterium litorale]|uniref:hypothetical protein n=1 Tax=Mycolicibacterium litorale TaxID=758802 RepID=UPI001623F888|nr:hypothetical protein [Mycolicibacterium litorale]